MPSRSTWNTFLALAAGAATAVTAVEYTRQKRMALTRISQGSEMIRTRLGPAEVAVMGDGPAVLVLHGVLAGYDQGLIVGRSLAEAGYQVIAPSRPGYLRTPPIKDMSFAGQADFLAAALDALKIKQAVVLGVSGGGPTAVHFAARHAERCRALLLFCAVSQRLVFDPETDSTTRLLFHTLMHMDFLTWLGIQVAIKALPLMALNEPGGWHARIMAQPDRRAQYERLLRGWFPSSLRMSGTQNDMNRAEHLDSLPFGQVAAPTLVMHGTADSLVPFAHGENSAKSIPGARFVPIPGADHAFHISHDDVVWPQVIAFLQRPATAPKPTAKRPAARRSTAKKAEPEKKPRTTRTTRRTPARSRPAAPAAPRRRRSSSGEA